MEIPITAQAIDNKYLPIEYSPRTVSPEDLSDFPNLNDVTSFTAVSVRLNKPITVKYDNNSNLKWATGSTVRLFLFIRADKSITGQLILDPQDVLDDPTNTDSTLNSLEAVNSDPVITNNNNNNNPSGGSRKSARRTHRRRPNQRKHKSRRHH